MARAFHPSVTRRGVLAAGIGLLASGPARAQDMTARSGAPRYDLVARQEGLDTKSAPSLSVEQSLQARAIGNDVVCLCGDCGRRTITDCECFWAQPNKVAIQLLVAKGKQRDEIIAAYRRAYGDVVLTMLPNEGLARAAWILPYAAALLGLGVMVYLGLRARRPAAQAAPEAPPAAAPGTERQLARELEELD